MNKFIASNWNLQINIISCDFFWILKLDRIYQYSSTKKIKIIKKPDEKYLREIIYWITIFSKNIQKINFVKILNR
jgi:hypothetical protein